MERRGGRVGRRGDLRRSCECDYSRGCDSPARNKSCSSSAIFFFPAASHCVRAYGAECFPHDKRQPEDQKHAYEHGKYDTARLQRVFPDRIVHISVKSVTRRGIAKCLTIKGVSKWFGRDSVEYDAVQDNGQNKRGKDGNKEPDSFKQRLAVLVTQDMDLAETEVPCVGSDMAMEFVWQRGGIEFLCDGYDDIFGCPLCVRRHDRLAENKREVSAIKMGTERRVKKKDRATSA